MNEMLKALRQVMKSGSLSQITTAYNALAAEGGKPTVKKFTNKPTAVKRATALIEQVAVTKVSKHGRRTYPLTAKVKLVVKENPKRAGTASHDRFKLYSKVTTVGEYLEAGGHSIDLTWDTQHGYVKVAA